MVRSIAYEVYNYDGWTYEHFEYIADQHTYSKTEEGKLVSRKCEEYEFNKAKLYGTEIKIKRKAS